MSAPATLPLDLALAEDPAQHQPRARSRRAAAGQRRSNVTSFEFKTLGEQLALEALKADYGVTTTGEAIRLAIRAAAAARGIDADELDQEAAAAA